METQWTDTLPSGWSFKQIRHIFKIHNGATPKSGEPEFWNGDINWITPEDLGHNENKEISESRRKITPQGYENSGVSLAPAGSIALSTRAPIGHLAKTTIPACVNQGCRLLEPMEGNPDYWYYASIAAKPILVSHGQGTTFMELPRQSLAAIKLPVPPLEEQQTIARFLDHKTAQIDALIAKKRALLDKLAEKRTALISHAVTNGLNPGAPMKDSGVAWLGEIPAHWEAKRLKFATDLINIKISADDSSLPYIGLEHIESWTGRKIDGEISNSEGLASSFSSGDVLFGKLRPYLAKVHLAEQDGLITSEALVIRSKKELHSKFLKFYMLSRDFIDIVDSSTYGSKMPRANWDFIGNLPVLLPDIKEQEAIANFLDFQTKQFDGQAQKINEAINRLNEYRAALITNAVTGKIDVRSL